MAGLDAGSCIWVLRFCGLQIALQIVIVNVTTLRWRPIVSSLSTGGWYFINFYAVLTVKSPPDRRWRCIYPIYYIPALCPIIFILLWAQRRAKAQGILNGEPVVSKASLGVRIQAFIDDVDAVGLFFLAITLALIFLPIVLAGGSVVTLPIFIFWETKKAAHPVIPWRVLRNRTIIAGCAFNFFNFFSFYLTYGELYGFVFATTKWEIGNLVYYNHTQSLSLTFFGLSWAVVAGIFKTGYKNSLIVALAIRFLDVGLMFYARSHINTTALGGIAAVASQTGAQRAVPHQDVTLATVTLLLSAELGNVVSTAAAGAIWVNRLPVEITRHLPQLNSTEIASYVGTPTLVRLLADEEYTNMVAAYSETMRLFIIPCIVIAVIPLIAAFFVKDFRLLEIQNAVDVKTLDGRRAQNASESIEPEIPWCGSPM
ncbi:hypothetical protein C8R43DRAFT_1189321 [Mycena crocata]|nr:hypothetical protein C8R43DRAFT_1189321 [Mycena crocata]